VDGPLHIALLTDGVMPFVLGGIQRHSRMLAEHLVRAGARVTLYHTAPAGELAERAKRLDGLDLQGLRSVFVEFPRGFWFPGHYVLDCHRYSDRLLDRFREEHARDAVDFVYAQGLTGLAFVRARRNGESLPPVGVNAHGYEMFQRCIGLKARLDQLPMRPPHRRVTRDADVVFSFSGKILEIVQQTIGTPKERIRVMPNAVDGSWMASEPRRAGAPRRFLFVGRYERRKGVPELCTALRGLSDCEWRMDFVGPIPDEHQMRDPRVTYHGAIRDSAELLRIYDTCDCIVCPSYAEGMPTVLIEAMARGMAAIATDVGAVSELVTPESGVLLPDPDPAGIANALREVARMPAERLLRMKAAGLAIARKMTWETVAAEVLSIARQTSLANGRPLPS
jgi:glycosyltransferase involved in cell wall biosynthesis